MAKENSVVILLYSQEEEVRNEAAEGFFTTEFGGRYHQQQQMHANSVLSGGVGTTKQSDSQEICAEGFRLPFHERNVF